MGQNISDCGGCRKNSEDNKFGIKSTIRDIVKIDYKSTKQNGDYFKVNRKKKRKRFVLKKNKYI